MSITNEQQEILSLVSKFGCLDIEQLKILLEPYEEKTVNMLVQTLIKNHMISIVNQRDKRYIVPFGNEKSLKHSVISCVWVMMELSTSIDEMKESMKAEAPALFYFTSNRKESFEIMYVDSNNLFKLNAVQEKYKLRNRHKSKAFAENYTVLVVGNKDNNEQENMALIRQIHGYELEFPFVLALVSGTTNGKPVIRTFKSVPKNVPNES